MSPYSTCPLIRPRVIDSLTDSPIPNPKSPSRSAGPPKLRIPPKPGQSASGGAAPGPPKKFSHFTKPKIRNPQSAIQHPPPHRIRIGSKSHNPSRRSQAAGHSPPTPRPHPVNRYPTPFQPSTSKRLFYRAYPTRFQPPGPFPAPGIAYGAPVTSRTNCSTDHMSLSRTRFVYCDQNLCDASGFVCIQSIHSRCLSGLRSNSAYMSCAGPDSWP